MISSVTGPTSDFLFSVTTVVVLSGRPDSSAQALPHASWLSTAQANPWRTRSTKSTIISRVSVSSSDLLEAISNCRPLSSGAPPAISTASASWMAWVTNGSHTTQASTAPEVKAASPSAGAR